MALVTRCPHCRMRFRVSSEQLRSHHGMVRCGACREPFNAAEALEYVEQEAPSPSPPPPGEQIQVHGAIGTEGGEAAHEPAAQTHGGPDQPARVAAPPPPAESPPVVPGRALAEEEEGEPEPLATLLGAPTQPGEGPAPEFLRRQARPGAARGTLAAGCSLLAVLLAIQCGMLFRAELQARVPALRPALAALCDLLSCVAQWPMRPEVLTVVSSELQALPGTDALEFNAVIRNRADYPVGLPALELKLTDTSDRTVGQKVFLPADYLRGARAEDIEAGADVAVRLVFEPPAPNVSSFYTYLFYP